MENALRACIEQQALSHADQQLLSTLVNKTLHNLCLSVDAEEFQLLAQQLDRLIAQQDADIDWALRMKSLTDRLGRAIGEWSDELYSYILKTLTQWLAPPQASNPIRQTGSLATKALSCFQLSFFFNTI